MQKLTLWIAAYLLIPAGFIMQFHLWLPFSAGFSWRRLLLWLNLLLILEAVFWLQSRYFIQPTWKKLNFTRKAGWLLASSIFTFLLFTYAGPNQTQVMEKFPFLAPVRSLALHPIYHADKAIIDLWKVKIGNQRIPNSELRLTGSWQEEKNRLWTSDPAASLIVEGKVPNAISISFWRSPSAGQVLVEWDGKSQILELSGQASQEAIFWFQYDTHQQEPALSRLIRWLTLPAWAYLAFSACGVFAFKNEI